MSEAFCECGSGSGGGTASEVGEEAFADDGGERIDIRAFHSCTPSCAGLWVGDIVSIYTIRKTREVGRKRAYRPQRAHAPLTDPLGASLAQVRTIVETVEG